MLNWRSSNRRFGPACFSVVFTAALLAPAAPARLAAQTAPTIDDALAAIAAYAPRAMAEQGTPGLSVAITDGTKTLRVLALGYANADTKAPVTPSTRFAIGSITKSMTALAILQAHDQGKIALDAPVQRYLPWFSIDSHGKPVLVHQLLSHSAGFPDDYTNEVGYRYGVVSLREARTLFAPGTAWSYSNDGFMTLGAVLASVDGRPWNASLRARVLDPIGMHATTPDFTPEAQASAAVGYQWRDSDRPGSLHPPLVASPPMDFDDPAGSVLSTPEDMARYMRLYLNGGRTENGTRLISQASFEAMTHPDRYAGGKPAGSPNAVLDEAPSFYRKYGYGLTIVDENGDHTIGHTGGISGYTACMQIDLTRHFGVVAMANLVEAPLHPCAIVLYAMRVMHAQAAGQPLPSPPPPPPDPAIVKNGAQWEGTYRAPSGATLGVRAEGDRLYLLDGAAKIALYPRGDDVFWADDPRFALFYLLFDRDKKNRVTEMTYGSQWYPNERYSGPRAFAHPPSWDGLVGRYENVFAGQPWVTRVLIVKDQLTIDGDAALKPLGNNAFALGKSIVRFGAFAGSQAERVSIDGTPLYRIDLP